VNHLPIHLDAALGRLERAADMAQQRGFSAAAQPHDGDQLSLRKNHVDALQHGTFIVGEIKFANFGQNRRRQS